MPENVKDDNRPASAAEVLAQHEFAKGLYESAIVKMQEVEGLITGSYDVPKDVKDQVGASVTNPVLPRAIIERIRQMMAIQTATVRVVPLKTGDKEQETCSKIERWVRGARQRTRYESKRDPDRDALFWYLLRGRADYEVRFLPDTVGKGAFPIQTLTDDPATIFPVRGRAGILWYSKEYGIFCRELKKELKKKGEPFGFLDDVDPNEELSAVEYWDDTYYAAVVKVASKDGKTDSHLVMSKKHKYGFIPLTEALCMDTPLTSAEWASQSVVGPVVSHVKQVYILASKMATGVNLFYYPLLYGVSASGNPVIVDPYNPGEPQPLALGSKLEVIPIQVNSAVLQQLMAFFKSDINLMTLPETAFGQEPTNLQSGFAIAQVLNAVQSAVSDKLPQMQNAMGDHNGNMLRLYEQFGGGTGMDFAVPFDLEG